MDIDMEITVILNVFLCFSPIKRELTSIILLEQRDI